MTRFARYGIRAHIYKEDNLGVNECYQNDTRLLNPRTKAESRLFALGQEMQRMESQGWDRQ